MKIPGARFRPELASPIRVPPEWTRVRKTIASEPCPCNGPGLANHDHGHACPIARGQRGRTRRRAERAARVHAAGGDRSPGRQDRAGRLSAYARSADFGVLAAVQLHEVGVVAALWLCDVGVLAAVQPDDAEAIPG